MVVAAGVPLLLDFVSKQSGGEEDRCVRLHMYRHTHTGVSVSLSTYVKYPELMLIPPFQSDTMGFLSAFSLPCL